MHPLRVLLLTPDFPPSKGGIQLLMQRLGANLPDAEVTVVTLAASDSAHCGPDSVPCGSIVRVVRVPVHDRRLAVLHLQAVAIGRALRHRPDVVLVGHVVCAPAAQVIRQVLGVPHLLYTHAKELGHRVGFARRALRKADLVVAVSSYTRGLVRSITGDAVEARILHPGVDAAPVPPCPRDPVPTVLTVARLDDEHKGHDVLIEAAALVREHVPDVRFVFVGDGKRRGMLEDQVREAGLQRVVQFVGRVDDAERDAWLQRARVFAMPSRVPLGVPGGEGFGIAYIEAGARGLPVVAGAVGGALDAIVPGQTGLLVDPESPRELAEALTRLLVDEELAERLGRGGIARAATLSWDQVAGRVRGLLGELAENARRR